MCNYKSIIGNRTLCSVVLINYHWTEKWNYSICLAAPGQTSDNLCPFLFCQDRHRSRHLAGGDFNDYSANPSNVGGRGEGSKQGAKLTIVPNSSSPIAFCLLLNVHSSFLEGSVAFCVYQWALLQMSQKDLHSDRRKLESRRRVVKANFELT